MLRLSVTCFTVAGVLFTAERIYLHARCWENPFVWAFLVLGVLFALAARYGWKPAY